MEAYMEWIWMGLLIFFGIVEAATVSLTSLWFVGGALIAMLVALFGGALWVQCVCFFAVSIGLLLCLRPLVRKYINPHKVVTNAESNIGKIVPVMEAIDNLHGKGAVRVSGVEWTAVSVDGKPIEKDAPVRIVRVEGAKLCVERTEK